MNDKTPAASGAAPALPTPWKTVMDATGEPVQVWRAFQMRDYARDVLALASPQVAPAPKPLDDPKLQQWFGDAIEGAMAFGFMGNNPPPEGHWLTRFWNIGRAEATKAAQPASPAPLTYDQIDTVYRKVWSTFPSTTRLIRFAHAIYALASPQVAPAVTREQVIDWLDGEDIGVTNKQMDRLFATPVQVAPAPVPIAYLKACGGLHAWMSYRTCSPDDPNAIPVYEGATPVQVAPQDDARDAAELWTLVRRMVALHEEHGTVLTVDMGVLAEMVAEHDSTPAAKLTEERS